LKGPFRRLKDVLKTSLKAFLTPFEGHSKACKRPSKGVEHFFERLLKRLEKAF
jgi:hypothetical protein